MNYLKLTKSSSEKTEGKKMLLNFLKILLVFPDRLLALEDALKKRNSFPRSLFLEPSSPLMDHNFYFSSYGDFKTGFEIHLLQSRFNPNALNDLQIEISNILYLLNKKELFSFVEKTKGKFGAFLEKLSKDDRESISSLWFESVEFVDKPLQRKMRFLIDDIRKFCLKNAVNYRDVVEFIFHMLVQKTNNEAYQKVTESIWCSARHDNVNIIDDLNHEFLYLRLGKNLTKDELETFIDKHWKNIISTGLKELKERKYRRSHGDFARDCSIYELHLQSKKDSEIKDLLSQKGNLKKGYSTEYIRKTISNFSKRLK